MIHQVVNNTKSIFTAWKVSEYWVFSGPYFLAFGLNKQIYSDLLCIQSEYGKIQTRKNSVFEHFSRSDCANVQAAKYVFNSLNVNVAFI